MYNKLNLVPRKKKPSRSHPEHQKQSQYLSFPWNIFEWKAHLQDRANGWLLKQRILMIPIVQHTFYSSLARPHCLKYRMHLAVLLPSIKMDKKPDLHLKKSFLIVPEPFWILRTVFYRITLYAEKILVLYNISDISASSKPEIYNYKQIKILWYSLWISGIYSMTGLVFSMLLMDIQANSRCCENVHLPSFLSVCLLPLCSCYLAVLAHTVCSCVESATVRPSRNEQQGAESPAQPAECF